MDIREMISFLLVQAAKEHRGCVEDSFSELGVRVGQDMVLLRLWGENGLSPTELANRLRVEPATVSKVLNRMEKAELVTRQRDPEDARSFKVYLTDRGKSLQEPLRNRWKQIEDQMLEGFTSEERTFLRRALSKSRDNLSRDTHSHPP
jgi:DNA-binding MarR family transcriptional regulator